MSHNIEDSDVSFEKDMVETGDIFMRDGPFDHQKYYMLAVVDNKEYSLINLETGGRWEDPVEKPHGVFNGYRDEFTKVEGGTLNIEIDAN